MKQKSTEDGSFPYADILHLSRPVSKNHPPMPLRDRAAQFAPFAALTGYEDAIDDMVAKTSLENEQSLLCHIDEI
jgi:hypothetical protein